MSAYVITGQIARHAQRELPAAAAVGFRRGRACGREHVGGNAGQLVFDRRRRAPTRWSRRARCRRTRAERSASSSSTALSRAFCAGGQLGAAQPEVAQLVRRRPSACAASSVANDGDRGERPVAREEAQVLREIGVECGDLRQVRVVRIAQRRRADDRVEMRDRAPRAIEPIERVGERLDDGVPGRRDARRSRPLRPRRAPAASKRSIGRRDVLRRGSRRSAGGRGNRAADWRRWRRSSVCVRQESVTRRARAASRRARRGRRACRRWPRGRRSARR